MLINVSLSRRSVPFRSHLDGHVLSNLKSYPPITYQQTIRQHKWVFDFCVLYDNYSRAMLSAMLMSKPHPANRSLFIIKIDLVLPQPNHPNHMFSHQPPPIKPSLPHHPQPMHKKRYALNPLHTTLPSPQIKKSIERTILKKEKPENHAPTFSVIA